MNPSKAVNAIRNYAGRSAIAALILLSPIIVFLMVIATEGLIDLLVVAGPTTACAAATGAVGLVLSRKFWWRGPASGAAKASHARIASV